MNPKSTNQHKKGKLFGLTWICMSFSSQKYIKKADDEL
jgi:hypothetical protein